ncbi:MAG: glycosyltransferase 87 family protein [Oscillospiraceae bacterium]
MQVTPLQRFKKWPMRWHWVAFAGIGLVAFLLFIHVDVAETANHSYLFLQSIFSGRFFHFYDDVVLHQNTLYYINNAHYNIIVYILFAIVELPVFIFNSIFNLPVNEYFLFFVGKLVGIGFFVACIRAVYLICRQLAFSVEDCSWCSLAFALCAPAFFSSFIMGQYDTLCLFFTLMGILCWMQKRPVGFALWFGLAATCKFFALFLFIPLLLLYEKRLLHIIKQGLICLWLLVPTTLLFYRRGGDMGLFNKLMAERLFKYVMPGAGEPALFLLGFFILCAVAYLWRPGEDTMQKAGLWLCLTVYALLFIFVYWHPQWIILVTPFIIITTFTEKNRLPWMFINGLFSAGFFIFTFYAYPYQLEGNLLNWGIVGLSSGLATSSIITYMSVSLYFDMIPYLYALFPVLFTGGLAANVILKLPLRKGSPAQQLSAGARTPAGKNMGFVLWAGFAAAMAVWAAPTAFTWLKCFGFL